MAAQPLIFKQVFPGKSDSEIANSIFKTLTRSRGLDISPSLLISGINSHVVHTVLSHPHIPHLACFNFFRFLLNNNSSSTFNKPDLHAHVTLALRLFRARMFAEGKEILESVAVDDRLSSRPVSQVADFAREKTGNNPKLVAKLMDMLLRVYVDHMKLKEAMEVFDYMNNNELLIDERSCMVFLLAAKRSNQFHSLFAFFQKMLVANVKITVYSMTMVVDGLCKTGKLHEARKLLNDMMIRRGVKPNEYTYNTLLVGCMKNSSELGPINEILKEMEKEGVELNATSYTVLIQGYSKLRKFEEVEKLFDKMQQGNIDQDIHLYTCMIDSYSRAGNIKTAFLLFDKLVERGVVPNTHTYGALINGLCKSGKMEAVKILLHEMQSKGVSLNQVIFNTLMDGYCKKGMINEAWKLLEIMEGKGLRADVYVYNIIATGLCKLKRHEDAKNWLLSMEGKGVKLNVITYTTLIDIYCKEGKLVDAKRTVREMEEKGLRPNVVTYNALIDGYCKKGLMREAYKVRGKMVNEGISPDVYAYTSLLNGECMCGNVDEALRLFREMGSSRGLVPTVVSYTALISGLSKAGRAQEAFGLYNEMLEAGLIPDDNVYSSLVGSLH
ncbi:unnamed protein product [Cuscuta epithymum]|uniref:Pentatricopeptide repeat-containing protein n=1 Tax=Cuscuta epithymum TaxID=186058 RepID=A0AAV0G9R1_9ASTE|nr:unnamed protein product [Cuscuta epithymum]